MAWKYNLHHTLQTKVFQDVFINLNVEVGHANVDGHPLVNQGLHGPPSLMDRNLGKFHLWGDVRVIRPLWRVSLLERHKLKVINYNKHVNEHVVAQIFYYLLSDRKVD